MYSQALPGFSSQNFAINECLIRVLFLMLIMWIRNPLFTVIHRKPILKIWYIEIRSRFTDRSL